MVCPVQSSIKAIDGIPRRLAAGTDKIDREGYVKLQPVPLVLRFNIHNVLAFKG